MSSERPVPPARRPTLKSESPSTQPPPLPSKPPPMRKSTRGSIDASVIGISLQRASTHDGSKTLPNAKASSLPTSPIPLPQQESSDNNNNNNHNNNVYQRVLPNVATLKTVSAIPAPTTAVTYTHGHTQSLPSNDIQVPLPIHNNNNNQSNDVTYQKIVLPRSATLYSDSKPKLPISSPTSSSTENDSIYQRVMSRDDATNNNNNFLPVPATSKPGTGTPNSNRARSPTGGKIPPEIINNNNTTTNLNTSQNSSGGFSSGTTTPTTSTSSAKDTFNNSTQLTSSVSLATYATVPKMLLVPPSGSNLTRSSSTSNVEIYQAILPERLATITTPAPAQKPTLSLSANADYSTSTTNSSTNSSINNSTSNPSSDSIPLPSSSNNSDSPLNRSRALPKKPRPEPPANVRTRMVNTMSRAQADRLKNAEKQQEKQLDHHLASLSLELKVPQIPPRSGNSMNTSTNGSLSVTSSPSTEQLNNNNNHQEPSSPKEPRTLAPMSPQQVQVEKRRLISEEILATEGTYVDTLDKVIKLYVDPLNEKVQSKKLKIKAEGFSMDKLFTMLNSLKLILPLNEQLRLDLKGRISKWSETQLVGDIFIKMAPFLKIYVDYGVNYETGIKMFLLARNNSKEFAQWLRDQRGNELLDVESCLITPIQRIPRYKLLIEQLLKETPAEHPDFANLQSALAKIQDAALHINSSLQKTIHFGKLMEIESLILKSPDSIVAPHRVFLKQGSVVDCDHGGKLWQLFLFNDKLIMTTPSGLFKNKFTFQKEFQLMTMFSFDAADTKEFRNIIRLQTPSKTFNLSCTTMEDKGEWLMHFDDARSKEMELEGNKMAFKLHQKNASRTISTNED